MSKRWDAIVIGSGFGGSVTALRLAERGLRVLVLEQGRRFAPDDFARSTWQLHRWLHAPAVGLRGPYRMSFLRHLTALTGVGVGGGSLVYAGVLQRPGRAFFEAPGWAGLGDWEGELAPHYTRAETMLGSAPVPAPSRADRILAKIALEDGRPEAHRPVRAGVHFGTAGSRAYPSGGSDSHPPSGPVPDPYFGGEGPPVTPCRGCGGCMVGCRFESKNTLDRNYLHLAEGRGAAVWERTTAVAIRPLPGGGYRVETLMGERPLPRRRGGVEGDRIILAGGVLGTVPLLLRMARDPNGLPRLSPLVGERVRTNSESLIGVVAPGSRISEGVAITSLYQVDGSSSLEPVRYPPGSGALRLLQAPHSPGETLAARLASGLGRAVRDPAGTARAFLTGDWGRDTLILLYMRADDSRLRLRLRRGTGWVTTQPDPGRAPRHAFPEATKLAERVAAELGGYPVSFLLELLGGIPTTAHLMGGAVVGASPETGVVGPDHQLWGYPGLHVVDGSALPANPGVNPSLTIAAMAERAAAFI